MTSARDSRIVRPRCDLALPICRLRQIIVAVVGVRRQSAYRLHKAQFAFDFRIVGDIEKAVELSVLDDFRNAVSR